MLYEKNDPQSPLNRRISIIVMNREAEDRLFKVGTLESANSADETEGEDMPPIGPIEGFRSAPNGR
jgi:chemotaxis protein MotB